MNYRIHVLRVSAEAVVVEAVTHHKVVRNLFAAVAYVELDLQFGWFEQECTDVDAGRILSFQGLEHVSHGETRVDDVFHDDDGPSGDVDVQADYFAYVARGVCALIGCELDERDFTRQFHFAHEVGCKDKGTIEDREENRLTASIVAIDFRCYALYFFL